MSWAATRLLTIGVVLIALVPPLATAVAGMLLERQQARAVAQALAWTIERQGLGTERHTLASLLEGVPHAGKKWGEAIDRNGVTLAASGEAPARGGLSIDVTVPVSGSGPVAAVRVVEPMADILKATVLAAILSIAAAAATWLLAVRRSVGALRRAEGQLRSIIMVDPLTGLLNRAGLQQRLKGSLAVQSEGSSRRTGVLLIDLDRFRVINESLGQRAGDELLRGVAARIRSVLRSGDAAARLGGDQFVVCTPALAGPQAAAVMARNLLRAIEPELTIAQRQTRISVSIGIALADSSDEGVDGLLAHADAAMRAAKAGGGGRYRVFEMSMLVNTQQQLELDMALRRALQAGEFELVYQPILEADGEGVRAVEALLRWNHPTRGLVSPGEFIPVLEQTGQIVPVGQWVLRDACRRMQSWIAHGATPVMLSVNVSPMQFAEPDFVRQVLSVLESTGFSAQHLQLEVTEGLLLDPTPDSLRKMDALVDAGVHLAIDDFGMGYSSLAYLKRFRLHTLKIDRMFVRDVTKQRKDTAIVRAIVELAHALELHVTAEGVETEDQHVCLQGLGCDSMQGFLFARPMPADDMRALLLAGSAHGAYEASPSDWSTTMAARLDIDQTA